MTHGDGLALLIEQYLDAAPRIGADVEQVGPFSLFVGRGPWDYYARPRLGLATAVDADDVRRLIARQHEIDVPTEIEWQPALTPSLAGACEAAGMIVHRFTLMVHGGPVSPWPSEVTMTAPGEDVGPALSAQQRGFGAASTLDPATVENLRERIEAGTTRVAVARRDGRVVSVGMHQPVAAVSEVVGVATVAEHRRTGWGTRVTQALVRDAHDRGASTVFLSAAGDAEVRVYEGAGFRRVGDVAAAEAGP